MIASLMMYDRPELSAAHSRYWHLIRDHLRAAGVNSPEALSQTAEEFPVWTDPHLVLSQTCGMPYRMRLHDKVALVGTPDYGITGCQPGYYRSALVVRANDPRDRPAAFRDAVFAYNSAMSQSGYAAPFHHMSARGFWFENLSETGAHLASARAVAEGQADIAAIDAVTWRLICRYEDFAATLRVLEMTGPTPGLPLITAKHHAPGVIYRAVQQAIEELSADDRDTLGVRGIVYIPKEVYLSVPNPH